MSDNQIEPLDPETLKRIYDLMYADIQKLPPEYNRWKIYATYHRISNLLQDQGKQTPRLEADEIESMKFYRKNGFSYHDIAYIFRRSIQTVHTNLRDMRFEETVGHILAEK